jgi:hypothetical protein
MPARLAYLLEPLGVSCTDAYAGRPSEAPPMSGWQAKAYALLHAPFRNVILLDADNVPLRDPAFLLESEPYRRAGAIFWPDYGPEGPPIHTGRLGQTHRIWHITGVPPLGEPEFESGQIVVDRVRHHRELALAMWFNEHADFWYRHVYGDKDTFHLAWRKLGTEYAMPPHPMRPLDGVVMLQHDFEGRVLFQHRHGDKWQLDGGNRHIQGFVDEEVCLGFVSDLRARLLGASEARRGFRAADLCRRRWLLTEFGRSPTVMTFHSDGCVGKGASDEAAFWKVREDCLEILDFGLERRQGFRYLPTRNGWVGLDAGAEMMSVG